MFLYDCIAFSEGFNTGFKEVPEMADKVLIVDDDPAICKLLEKVMRSNELDPTIAMSGKEALNIIKNHTFDIILMDVMLGDMEGFEVIKKIEARVSALRL